ncbi:MAG: invasion associated locus B family protein [Erythrobacter sp.]
MTRSIALTCFCAALSIALTTEVSAKDNLGVFSNWAAFRDPGTPRCYAIAKPRSSSSRSDYAPYASVANWPRRNIRGQFHIRLSREMAQDTAIRLTIAGKNFALTGGGGDAWAQDAQMDAAIIAAMRSATRMSVTTRDASGRRFTDRYQLAGAATAIDASVVGCAQYQ